MTTRVRGRGPAGVRSQWWTGGRSGLGVRNSDRLFCAVLVACAVPAGAGAQDAYPAHTISMTVPFAPGGPTDVFARILAERLGQELGQSIVVLNRGGAAGNIGVAQAARTAPDGYNLLFGTASIAVAPSVYKKLNYDALTDLQPVALLGSCPALVLVSPDGPNSVERLVSMLKAAPGKYSYATSGYASATHLVTGFFNHKAGIDAFVVPYTGSGPAHQGMIAKRHLYTFETASSAMPLVQGGTLKAIAIASDHRSPILPDVPTIEEAGISGVNASTWNMVFVPKGTPAGIVDKLNKAINKVLSDPATVTKLKGLAIEVTSDSTPASSEKYLKSEITRWADIARISGIQPNE
ncbi:Bug family tripartite tricarboxylate transporter substrate binding protein [Pigmentiphaga daeguensis]|uniref:Tripartite tricarboxylate transporter substrate binding protein n=1 Tax=Pigmentiphaga daeguensis TaxID=414049 RepID=A0ABN1CYW5_9BURK